MDSDLGYLSGHNGYFILAFCIIVYMGLYTYLYQEYGDYDDEP